MAIGGSGTQTDPWTINSADDLVTYSNNYGTYWTSGKYTILTTDIDMSEISNFKPIGRYISSSYSAYYGNFDGQNHVISNLTIDNPYTYTTGLFGTCYGNLQNIGCIEFEIKATHRDSSRLEVGSLAGYVSDNASGGKISKCYATNCIIYVSGDTSDEKAYVGGLIGNITGTSISNCYTSNCNITSYHYGGVGGLSGRMYTTTSISNCYAYNCTMNASKNSYRGGLIGYSDVGTSSISNCAIYGGFCGNQLCGYPSSGTGTNCYTSSNISSETFHTKEFWDGKGISGTRYLSWDFTDTWTWDSEDELPKFKSTEDVGVKIYVKVSGEWKQ